MLRELVAHGGARSPPVSTEDVAQRAYARWLARSRTWDWQLDDWLAAEAQLSCEVWSVLETEKARAELRQLQADRRVAERRLLAEHAVIWSLATASTLADAAPKLVQAICDCLDWDVGALWLLDQDARLLRCVTVWHRADVSVTAFEKETCQHTFSPGVGLPGRVWSTETIAWIPDVTKDANFPRAPIAAAEGLRGAVGFPVHNGQRLLGVLEFFSREVQQPDKHLTEMMSCICCQISQFIERRDVERRILKQDYDRRIAREIQQGCLPKSTPHLPGFEISGRSTAPNDVGGDCFDFIPLRAGEHEGLGVLIADASGHGIGAALLVGQTRAYLRGLSLTCPDVGTLLELTNRCVTDLVSNHFVTAFLLRVEAHRHTLSFSGAGHLPVHVLNRRGEVRAVLRSSGLPLGIETNSQYPVAAVSLEPGDLVLLMTDGITEAGSPTGTLFGTERALKLVGSRRDARPAEILAALFDEVETYCHHGCTDDLTAVIIKVDE